MINLQRCESRVKGELDVGCPGRILQLQLRGTCHGRGRGGSAGLYVIGNGNNQDETGGDESLAEQVKEARMEARLISNNQSCASLLPTT